MTGPVQPRLRPAVRAVVLDPDDRLLLVRLSWPTGWDGWVLPGGGVDPGEDDFVALRRELVEEVGLHDPDIGPCLWRREVRFRFGDWDGQREHVHLVRTHAFEPSPAFSLDELAAEHVAEIRWWRLDALDASADVCSPSRLAALVCAVLRDGPPAQPWLLDR